MPAGYGVPGALVLMVGLGACSVGSGTGPLREALIAQGEAGGQRQFDVVAVDDRVVDAVQAHAAAPAFHRHFKPYLPPPRLPIAPGDRVSVVIWESSANGLFAASRAPRQPRLSELAEAIGSDAAALAALADRTGRDALVARLETTARGRVLLQSLDRGGRAGTEIADLPVGRDGRISIPYAGRITAAGSSPAAVQRAIERRLAARALDPRALVIVKRGPASSVTVTGDLVAGARIPIKLGGSRLLQIIAAAGGARASPHEAYVRLSRAGVTASAPLAALIEHPDENIYARPGDVVAVVRRPRTVTVLGAVTHSTAFTFDSDTLSLGEALARAGGLRDDRADPRAVFVLRYETPATARRLGLAPIPAARDGPSPVAYRFDLSDTRSTALAERFAVRSRDVIYVAEAETEPIRRLFAVLGEALRPIVGGLLVCNQTRC